MVFSSLQPERLAARVLDTDPHPIGGRAGLPAAGKDAAPGMTAEFAGFEAHLGSPRGRDCLPRWVSSGSERGSDRSQTLPEIPSGLEAASLGIGGVEIGRA